MQRQSRTAGLVFDCGRPYFRPFICHRFPVHSHESHIRLALQRVPSPWHLEVDFMCPMRPREFDDSEQEQVTLMSKSVSEFLLPYTA